MERIRATHGAERCAGARWHVRVVETLCVRPGDDQLTFVRDHFARPWESKAILAVERGSWGRVLLNSKAANHDAKWLNEIIVNAGVFDEPPPGEIFLGRPAAERDVRRDFLRNGYR